MSNHILGGIVIMVFGHKTRIWRGHKPSPATDLVGKNSYSLTPCMLVPAHNHLLPIFLKSI